MVTKIQIVFYSMYGHVYQMANAVAAGVCQVEGVDVAMYQVPELIPDETLERMGAKAAREAFADVPVMLPFVVPDQFCVAACAEGARARRARKKKLKAEKLKAERREAWDFVFMEGGRRKFEI